jgi:hypothetical protein
MGTKQSRKEAIEYMIRGCKTRLQMIAEGAAKPVPGAEDKLNNMLSKLEAALPNTESGLFTEAENKEYLDKILA